MEYPAQARDRAICSDGPVAGMYKEGPPTQKDMLPRLSEPHVRFLERGAMRESSQCLCSVGCASSSQLNTWPLGFGSYQVLPPVRIDSTPWDIFTRLSWSGRCAC